MFLVGGSSNNTRINPPRRKRTVLGSLINGFLAREKAQHRPFAAGLYAIMFLLLSLRINTCYPLPATCHLLLATCYLRTTQYEESRKNKVLIR